MKEKTYWKSVDTWCCANHFPPAVYHRLAPRCSSSSCNSIRPLMSHQPKVISKEPPLKLLVFKTDDHKCSWDNCKRGKNGSHANQTTRSKYCSIQCKNDYARHRHKLRKLLKRIA